jgi:type I restriction enzyme S subunit
MMEGWKTDIIGNLFEVKAGGDLQESYFSSTRTDEFKYPIYANSLENKGLYGYTSKPRFFGNAVTITGRGDIGHAEFRPDDFDAIVRLLVLLPKTDIDCRYVTYYLNSLVHFPKESTGVPQLTAPKVKRIKINLPQTKSEQSAIAAILSKVDEAITAVQASISAAERLKKSLMQNLLTGRMKPDGTLRKEDEFYLDEKFGRVPLGWEVKKVKDLFYMNQNTLSSNTNADYRFKYITIEAVNTEKIEFENCPCYSFKDSPGRARRIIKDNDILISGVRPNLKAFAIYYKPDSNNWICSTGFHVLTAKEKVCPQFFFYQILSSIGASQFHSWVAGSNYPAIGDSDMKNMLLYTPPYEEQLVINQKFESISKSQKEKQSKIAILERLKKSLMQNLLTGRVRVN